MGLRGDVSKRLEALGYRRAGRMHLRPIDAEFSSVVDTGPLRPNANDIVPWVGLRSESVERFRAALLGTPFDEDVGTVGGFGYQILGTEFAPFRDPAALEEVLRHIEQAEGVMKRFASLDRLPDAWAPEGVAVSDPYTQVTFHVVRGDGQSALEALAEGERTECASDDEVCEQFRAFERAVKARLAVS